MQLHTHDIYNYFLKVNCFLHRLKVLRSVALLVASDRELQVEIAKYWKVLGPKVVVATLGTMSFYSPWDNTFEHETKKLNRKVPDWENTCRGVWAYPGSSRLLRKQNLILIH